MISKQNARFGGVFGLSGIFFLFLQLAPIGAHDWGLNKSLNNAWLGSALVTHVIQNHEVDYCIEIGDPRFATGTIQRQVEAALRLWLKPLEDLGVEGVTLRKVDCVPGTFNLKLAIGPETERPTLGSYQLPQFEGGFFYSLVKIDSNYTFTRDGKSYQFVDFEQFVQPGKTLDSLLNQISVSQPTTVQAFATSLSVDMPAVYWSTYRVLIHELGHSFGLCDTYDPQLAISCDPEHMSATQPSSVMKDSTYFYLTSDDITGIKTLFTRFLP